MSPEPPDAEIAEAAGQFAAWIQFRLNSGKSSLSEVLESGLPAPIRGKQSFFDRLGGAGRLIAMPEPDLAARLANDPWFRRWGPGAVRRWKHSTRVAEMTPRWEGMPVIATAADLADWLGGLRPGELQWLAGIERGARDRPDRLANYTHRWVQRKHGAPPRLLAAPKPLLKRIQRKILHHLLDRAPLHDAAHGFRQGRSIRSFAEPHVGADCVLRVDLADFFPSIRFGRVESFFETAGYPATVARLLAGLCCHAAPAAVIRAARIPRAMGDRLRRPHLPQGAPTSPALSNAIAFRLDRRLAGLAAASGAHYTRYADDLAFSGDRGLWRGSVRFLELVAAIVLEEGFEVNYRKIRAMPACGRQRIAGVVVNTKPNTTRATYDELKAALHRWETKGLPEGEELFAGRLLGRIAALGHLNPEKGAKLRQRFDRLLTAETRSSTSPPHTPGAPRHPADG